MATTLEDAIEDGLSQVGIMQDDTPGCKWLVGGKDDGLAVEVALVDDLEEHVCGVVGEAEIANLVDHEHVRVRIGVECAGQAAGACGVGEFFDE